MKERDVYEAIIDIGKQRGSITYDEINEALPAEFFSLEELEEFMSLLTDMGVKMRAQQADKRN